MFLNLLSDNEKEAFLELAFKLANSDLSYTEDEAALINQYRHEMSLTREIYDLKGLDSDHCLKILANSSPKVKKIIYFELLALAMCDQELDKKEHNLLNEIKNSLDINDIHASQMARLIKTLTDTYKEIEDLLK